LDTSVNHRSLRIGSKSNAIDRKAEDQQGIYLPDKRLPPVVSTAKPRSTDDYPEAATGVWLMVLRRQHLQHARSLTYKPRFRRTFF
jgi:hypothetical protein